MYLEMIPDKYIKNKAKIIEALKAQQQMMAIQQQQMMIPTEEDPNATRGMQDGVDNRAMTSMTDNQQLQDTYAQSKEFYQ